MIIVCKYNQNGICLNSNEKVRIGDPCYEGKWICGETCPIRTSEYTERDRNFYLLKCLSQVKEDNVGTLCTQLMCCGHRANSNNDEFAILYDACIIRLLQLHQRRYLVSDNEYCTAFVQARRLGIRLPGRSGKIYKRCLRNVERYRLRSN